METTVTIGKDNDFAPERILMLTTVGDAIK